MICPTFELDKISVEVRWPVDHSPDQLKANSSLACNFSTHAQTALFVLELRTKLRAAPCGHSHPILASSRNLKGEQSRFCLTAFFVVFHHNRTNGNHFRNTFLHPRSQRRTTIQHCSGILSKSLKRQQIFVSVAVILLQRKAFFKANPSILTLNSIRLMNTRKHHFAMRFQNALR
jgi:hypothetical protein